MKKITFAVFMLVLFSCCAGTSKTDPSCEEFADQSQKDGCYQEKGIVTNDPAYCDMVSGSDFRDRCFLEIAKDRSRRDLCARIVKENDKNHCYALITRNDSFCALVDLEDRRDKCYYDVGLSGRARSCGKISDAFFRDNCYIRHVYASGDYSWCGNVSEKRMEDCYYVLAEKSGWSDPGACSNIPIPEYKEECLQRMLNSGRNASAET